MCINDSSFTSHLGGRGLEFLWRNLRYLRFNILVIEFMMRIPRSVFFIFFFFFFFLLVAEAKRHLVAAGFHLLNEDEQWDLKPCGCYFFTRNMSCLVAFSIGEK